MKMVILSHSLSGNRTEEPIFIVRNIPTQWPSGTHPGEKSSAEKSPVKDYTGQKFCMPDHFQIPSFQWFFIVPWWKMVKIGPRWKIWGLPSHLVGMFRETIKKWGKLQILMNARILNLPGLYRRGRTFRHRRFCHKRFRHRHFVTRIFCPRTFCHTDFLSHGHFVTWTFRHRTFRHRTFRHMEILSHGYFVTGYFVTIYL